jgi:hypothetical protein
LDLSQPVALMMLTILQLIAPAEDPWAIVKRLVDALPSGSYLVVSHPTGDFDADAAAGAAERLSRLMPVPVTLRGREDVQRFFEGLELVDPGLVQVSQWRPDPADQGPQHVSIYGGVALKP